MSRFVAASALRQRPGVFAALEGPLAAKRARGEPIAPLHIGDTCFPPPEGCFAPLAAADTVARELSTYGPTSGLPALLEALAAAEKPLLGEVDASCILFGPGGTFAFGTIARAVLEAGDDVLVLAPYWPGAHSIFTAVGANVLEVAAPVGPGDAADTAAFASALAAAVTPKTRALSFASPNNPDGVVFPRSYLSAILALAEAHDLFVFADEVYAHGFTTAPVVPFASLPGAAARAATIRSFSKRFALAGARLGYAIAPPAVVAAARRLAVFTIFAVPPPLQRVALAALAAPPSYDAAQRAFQARQRELAATIVAAILPEAPFVEPAGGAYLFLDFRGALGGRPLEALLALAIEEGALLCPGSAFGEGFEGFARLCFTAAPEEALRQGISALRRAVDRLRRGA